MGSRGMKICMALAAIVSIISTGAMAQSSCMNAFFSMYSCLSYVTGSSKTPSSSCCSALSGVLQSQPRCLCTIANGGGSSLGVQINQTLALALPGACKLQTPPVSRCYAGNGPAMSPMPMGSPEGSVLPTEQRILKLVHRFKARRQQGPAVPMVEAP
ncbi:non-specific lipid transfer protein GPI-anchored 5-like [Nicotiana tabacum]|uniref:Non-specific lipid transfer protein GPI-anchored 2-like n=2 Tax=Nicotiana TaxID=4085 RepID=A0A1S4CPN8_TOBAC|nr:PREDICTED: non-specific lipid transfer protein GPI-anchored 2-like [Nicotiana sylvestris]XP_016503016.1 PREDICTED: non-specific lipid transfer protein GPI-anchored 2-like [Nicotiana tabacum]